MEFKGTTRVTISGFDNSGRGFSARYSGGGLGFSFGHPDLTDADQDAIRNIGDIFLNAYGK